MSDELRIKNPRKKVIIGVSSGIAAFKIPELIRILRTKDIDVTVIMTDHATKMIHPDVFIKASGHPVYTSLFKEGFDYREVLDKREVEHIKLADSAGIFVIAPATANIIGKTANGIADDLLTTTVMATTAPVLLCPSMNVHMWNNPIVRENLTRLKDAGYFILNPDKGRLACGYEGVGRLRNIQTIAGEILDILSSSKIYKNRKIIVTAGGTMEAIDPVRYITNKGSGKMGEAIAGVAKLRGAEVLLIRSQSSVEPEVSTDQELFEDSVSLEALVKKSVKKYDYIFHTAAVSDFIPFEKVHDKIDSSGGFTLKLKPAEKILHKIKSWNPNIKVIGFKAVYKKSAEEIKKIGEEKLKQSKSDFIIVNDVGREGIGFGTYDNEVYIISKRGFEKKVARSSKKEIARKILDFIIGS